MAGGVKGKVLVISVRHLTGDRRCDDPGEMRLVMPHGGDGGLAGRGYGLSIFPSAISARGAGLSAQGVVLAAWAGDLPARVPVIACGGAFNRWTGPCGGC